MALKAFSLDQSGLSHKVQNHIELALSVLKARMERPDLTPLEAREIRQAILDLVREAREEIQRAAHPHRWVGGFCDDGRSSRWPAASWRP